MSTEGPGVKDSALQPHLVSHEVTQVSCSGQVGGGGTEGDAQTFCGARPSPLRCPHRNPGERTP